MKRYIYPLMYLAVAAAAIGAIGYSYERCIGPSQVVWHAKARDWSSMPLKVYWDRSFWGEAHSESFEAAIDAWNSEVRGRQLFVVGKDPAGAEVQILTPTGEPCSSSDAVSGDDEDAAAWLCPGGTAEIHIAAPGTINCSARIAMHELGHVLGFDHVDVGIMRATIGCDDLMIPSDAQAAALQERYGPR